jgi:23S rRNA (pseudouridine1915-N3)-methyltransferase
VKLTLAVVAHRRRNPLRNSLFDPAANAYLGRLGGYTPVETAAFRDEPALFEFVARQSARTSAWLVLMDSRGKSQSSEEFARWLAVSRDAGQQNMIFAIGPADGWSDDARRQAQTLLSLGPMTLPHELARVVLAEQLYRAFTILAGHPYHGGH